MLSFSPKVVRGSARLWFQFSIGDADATIRLWSTWSRSWQRQVSILYWRCQLWIKLERLPDVRLVFQFSIGDAGRRLHYGTSEERLKFQFSIGDAEDANRLSYRRAYVSILYWRCFKNFFGFSFTFVKRFQFSIGDA